METRSLKGFKKWLAQLTENRLAQWLSKHNFAHTACSLPCVMVDARPPVDHTVLVLVLFSQASAVGHSWGRTWYSSYNLCHLPWELCIQQAFLQLPLEQSYDALGRDHQGVWAMSLGADALSSFSWRSEFQLQYHHRVRLGWMCTWVQRKWESLQSQILPQPLHSGTIDECLCSQPWLFIRSCHFFHLRSLS